MDYPKILTFDLVQDDLAILRQPAAVTAEVMRRWQQSEVRARVIKDYDEDNLRLREERAKLAEESEARRVYIESFEPQAVATGEENQRLREQLEAAKRDQQALGMLRLALDQLPHEPAVREAAAQRERTAKLLALLDSEEPPEAVFDHAHTAVAFGNRYAARQIWRWLREQVAERQGQGAYEDQGQRIKSLLGKLAANHGKTPPVPPDEP